MWKEATQFGARDDPGSELVLCLLVVRGWWNDWSGSARCSPQAVVIYQEYWSAALNNKHTQQIVGLKIDVLPSLLCHHVTPTTASTVSICDHITPTATSVVLTASHLLTYNSWKRHYKLLAFTIGSKAEGCCVSALCYATNSPSRLLMSIQQPPDTGHDEHNSGVKPSEDRSNDLFSKVVNIWNLAFGVVAQQHTTTNSSNFCCQFEDSSGNLIMSELDNRFRVPNAQCHFLFQIIVTYKQIGYRSSILKRFISNAWLTTWLSKNTVEYGLTL